VRTGVDAGATLVLDGRRVTAGSGNGCDLIVRDTTVSREHAAFVLRGDVWWVLDLGSTNGTRSTGCAPPSIPSSPGDRIELGDVVVELVEA
jgi:pSer/pThr/pTyr-binding forkhead associated (FHA) protein